MDFVCPDVTPRGKFSDLIYWGLKAKTLVSLMVAVEQKLAGNICPRNVSTFTTLQKNKHTFIYIPLFFFFFVFIHSYSGWQIRLLVLVSFSFFFVLHPMDDAYYFLVTSIYIDDFQDARVKAYKEHTLGGHHVCVSLFKIGVCHRQTRG